MVGRLNSFQFELYFYSIAATTLQVEKLGKAPAGLLSHAPDGEAIASGARSLVLAHGRSDACVAFDREIVVFFVEVAHSVGVPKSVAAIYGVCFSSPEALSFGEIGARLDISKGSLSQGLRFLRDAGALRLKVSPAERTARFEPNLELRNLVLGLIDQKLKRQLLAGDERLAVVSAAIPQTRDHAQDVLQARVKSLRTWQDKSKALIPLVKAFLALT